MPTSDTHRGGGGNGIKLPFDALEATRSIVRVMHNQESVGCGFVAAGRFVITAGHCLPQRPDHLFDDEIATTIRSWDGNDETRLALIYCDLLSDIAVLTNERLSGGDFPHEWAEAFDRLLARTGSARIDLSFPVKMPLRSYIRTHEGAWLTGSTEFSFLLGPMFSAFIDEGKKIPAGTSGSPVFNQKGELMGLVSQSGENDGVIAGLAGYRDGLSTNLVVGGVGPEEGWVMACIRKRPVHGVLNCTLVTCTAARCSVP